MSNTDFKVVRQANSPEVRWGVLHNNQFAGFGDKAFSEMVVRDYADFPEHYNEDSWNNLFHSPVESYDEETGTVVLGEGY